MVDAGHRVFQPPSWLISGRFSTYGRGGMAQDRVEDGAELAALMNLGRWQSSKMPARYTERAAADRGVVARYYERG